MASQETSKERKQRFKAMSSAERKALIRAKLKAEGLQEGSGVPGKDLSSYDQYEVWDLIKVTSCIHEVRTKPRKIQANAPNKKRSLIGLTLLATALVGGMVLYYRQYPSPETRKEISVGGMFAD